MSTAHMNANKEDIAKLVIMPGDPLRAKFIAESYLENYKLVNTTRNMLGFTGYYKNKKITIMASGMGNASMGIYSYELFKEYDVDTIIRVGTCGSYKENIKLYDVVLVENSYSNSSYGIDMGYNNNLIEGNKEINRIIGELAKKSGIDIVRSNIHNTDTFYNDDYSDALKYDCVGVEMETFALFINAKKLHKRASAILTVSNNLVLNNEISSVEREKSTIKMIELALDSIINL